MKAQQMIVIAAALLSMAACGSSETTTSTAATQTAAAASTTETTTAAPATRDRFAPFHAVPTDMSLISGSATCTFSFDPLVATCRLDMSDPRVTGTETHAGIIVFDGGEVGDVWFAADATITNDGGSWTGWAQAADDAVPIGEANYVGDGAYAGLEFHYYFYQADIGSPAKVLGWISDGA